MRASGVDEAPAELPAPWVERYLERSGGWRLAPDLLVQQLAELEPPAPLVLIPRRQAKKLNAGLDFLEEPALALIHPDDAAPVGIVSGAPVVVRSDRVEITALAKVDDGIRRGVVSVPHGHHAANVNALTDMDRIDPVTGMVRYSAVPVTIEPLSARRR